VAPADVVEVAVDVVVVVLVGAVRAMVPGFEEVVDAVVVVRVRRLATGVGGLEEGRARTGSRAPAKDAG